MHLKVPPLEPCAGNGYALHPVMQYRFQGRVFFLGVRFDDYFPPPICHYVCRFCRVRGARFWDIFGVRLWAIFSASDGAGNFAGKQRIAATTCFSGPSDERAFATEWH
jgi:hypothetical protein